MLRLTYIEAANRALREEIALDSKVFILGEDVEAGIFGLTKGLVETFGEERVRNTPISEEAIAGVAIGAAMCGMRPVVDLMLANFVYPAMDQIINQAAKLRYMSDGQIQLPIVFMASTGAGGSTAPQHSDNPISMFMEIPGLIVVSPSNPYDMKGLLKAAIRNPNPVLVFPHVKPGDMVSEVPEDDYIVPLGKASIVREGHDVTVVATSVFVSLALELANKMHEEGLSIEVIDPRTFVPLDHNTIIDSARKTGRVVVFDDGPAYSGFAAEIAATVTQGAFDYLDAPVLRVTRKHAPIPYSPALEKIILPNEEDLMRAIKAVTYQ